MYYARSKDAAHDHVVFHLKGGLRVVYNDARRFGFMLLLRRDELETHPLLAELGIEPTGNALSAAALAPRFAGRAAPLKAILSDQKVIAGPGQHLCLRGAVARPAVAAPRRRLSGARRTASRPSAWSGLSRRCAP